MSELKAYQVICTDDIDRNEITENFSAPDFLAYDADEVDKVISDLEESHKMEIEQLLMEIAGLKKLVGTADKLLKSKGGFTVNDITFNGVKLDFPNARTRHG